MRDILKNCRLFVFYTGLFSFFLNILGLVPIIYMLNMMDRVLSSGSVPTLISLTSIVVFFYAIDAFLETIHSSLLNRFSVTLHRLLGQPVLQAILALKHQEGQSRHGLEDVELLQNFIITKAVKALFDLPWLPFYIVILYFFHPTLAFYAIGAIILLMLLAFWENKATKGIQVSAGAAARDVDNFLTASFRNHEIISALGVQNTITQRWSEKNDHYLAHQNNVTKKTANIQALSAFVRHMITTLAMASAAYLVITENLTIGILIASNMLLGKAMSPIGSVINASKSLINAKAAYNRLNKLLPHQTPINTSISLPTTVLGQLSVQELTFCLTKNHNILNAVSFSITPGECLAIIGASASGKSTLAKILVGYYGATSGTVRLDNTDISIWSKNGLGTLIGYLPQDIQLFSGSVAENIARLEPVTANHSKIIAAAKQARVHNMILNLPAGYDTDIGERGQKLSGGQRQRLALARALYGHPNYIVLDEPNSNLDGQSELELIEIIKELKELKITVIVISHKPNLVEVADKILALHEGKVVKFGQRQAVLSQLSPA